MSNESVTKISDTLREIARDQTFTKEAMDSYNEVIARAARLEGDLKRAEDVIDEYADRRDELIASS